MLQILSHLGGKKLGFHPPASISHWFRAPGKRGSRVCGGTSTSGTPQRRTHLQLPGAGDLHRDSQVQVLGAKVTVTGGGGMDMVKGITRDPGGALWVFTTCVS